MTPNSPTPRYGLRAARLLLCSLGLWLAACSPVDQSDLPPVPALPDIRMLPAVTGQFDAAIARVERRPTNASANGHLGMLFQTYRQFNAAEVMYRRVRMLEPQRFDWAYLHGVVLIALGRPDDAIAALQAARGLRADYPFASIRLAGLLGDRGERDAAAALYAQAMAGQPVPSEAYFSYGKFLLEGGELDGAIDSFKKALAKSGNFGMAHYQLGMAYREQGRADLAAEHLRLAQRHHGYSADSGDEILNRLLALNRSDQPFVRRAKMLAENGRLGDARTFIEMALERNPDSVAAHASMIGLAASDRDFARADAHFRRAVALAPDNAKIHFNLGMARLAEERFSEAEAAFERARELDDTDPNVFVQLAILRHRQGHRVLTARHLRAALALAPSHQLANWLYGEHLVDTNKPQQAVPYLERATATPHRQRSLMLVALARANAGSGRRDVAQQNLADARVAALDDAGMLARVAQVAATLALVGEGGAGKQ